MRFARRLAALAALVLLSLVLVQADDRSHTYEDKEEVTLWVNKIGPYHNPSETYDYYKLPFCKPDIKTHKRKKDSLGVHLEGNNLKDSGYAIGFKENQDRAVACELEITPKVARHLTKAVREHYWYQMYLDELPLWGMVGEFMVADLPAPGQQKADEQSFVYTHKSLSILFNGNQVIQVNLTSENPKPITVGETYEFTYSVLWRPTMGKFEDRFDRYLDFDFFEHQIHWFSLFNSFMMVVFLCGVVALILARTLKHDYARYSSEEDEMELDRVVDESGWKQVHGDVFRAPNYLMFYSAFVGTGVQLLILAVTVISLTLVGSYYDERGTILSTFIGCFSLTSFFAGYSSAGVYKRHDGRKWKKTMLLTASLLPWIVFGSFFLLNFVALSYRSQATIKFTHMLTMVAIWALVQCPLVVLGTVAGRSTTVVGDFPCRSNSLVGHAFPRRNLATYLNGG